MPSGGDQHDISTPDRQRLSTVSTLGSLNSFYTAPGNMTLEHNNDDQSVLQDLSANDIALEDTGNNSIIAADLDRSTAIAPSQPGDDTSLLTANRTSDYSSANATVGTANHDNDNMHLAAATSPVADLTSHTLSPALQHLSFVNFNNNNGSNNDEPSMAPSVDATVGSSMMRSGSMQSNNSTGTMVHEDTLVRGTTNGSILPHQSPAATTSTSIIPNSMASPSSPSSSPPPPSSQPGKRPALPDPSAFGSDNRSSVNEVGYTPNASIQPSPAPSDHSRDYFYQRGSNKNSNSNHGGGSGRPITFSGVNKTSPNQNQYNSNTISYSDRRRQRRPPHSRRASASAYADSERERTESELDELDDLMEEENYLSGGSTSDTDDYGDPEERKRAHRRHRRRRMIRLRRARLRRAQSAYVGDGVNGLSNSVTSNGSMGANMPGNSEPGPSSRGATGALHPLDVDEDDEDDENGYDMLSDHEMTLKDRQEAINSSHLFGLPLWKPALYKKDRSVQRAAESAVHSMPTSQRYVTFDNILWFLLVGWWISLVMWTISLPLLLVRGGKPYARVFRGLGWYLLWPFGKCVERITRDRWSNSVTDEMRSEWAALEQQGTLRSIAVRSVYGDATDDDEEGLSDDDAIGPDRLPGYHRPQLTARNWASKIWQLGIGGVVYYMFFFFIVAPLLYSISAVCWFFVFTLPMAKLTKGLARHLALSPLSLRFRCGSTRSANSVVLLCTYKASGLRYYKYTYDGINIFFINLLPLVFFVLFCAHVLGPYTHHENMFTRPGAIFMMCLCSVIPLAYFIGMAVSSISAQSSLGMGAVINATFGSIVEVILYCFAIIQGKEELVEGSLIGSLLCGLLLLPGLSMVSGGIRRKEQKFNSKSAGVTSTMLILSLIGVFTPTLFHQIYGSFEMICEGCPADYEPGQTWRCKRCTYDQTRPEQDDFFQSNTKPLMYICTIMLPLAYLVALWFTLRTHVKLIYHQEPLPQDNANELRASFYKRLLQQLPPLLGGSNAQNQGQPRAPLSAPAATDRRRSTTMGTTVIPPSDDECQQSLTSQNSHGTVSATIRPTGSSGNPTGHTLNLAIPLDVMQPAQILADDDAHKANATGGGGHGGHDAPEWSKVKSSVVLLSCTVLFAAIAELLVDTVDEVMDGLTLSEKFLGVTLFALVPNVTEFTNAIAFALYGNIALSMEIGSAYAVQVTLLQIPAVVAFSAWRSWHAVGDKIPTGFLMLFPTWDVIVSILSVFLLTYIYIEGKSNYFKGSILTIAYLIFVGSFYFEPPGIVQEPGIHP